MLKVLMDLGLLSDNFLRKCFSNFLLQGNSQIAGKCFGDGRELQQLWPVCSCIVIGRLKKGFND